MSPQEKEWDGTTGGGRFGQVFLFWILTIINVSFLYPVLFGVIPFYLVFARKGYFAIYSYFRFRHHQSKTKAFVSTFRNHLIFGKIVLDKFALLAGNYKQFIISVQGNEYFKDLTDTQKGFFVISAHIGNFELIGHCFKQDKKKINGIVFGGEGKEFQKQRIKSLQRSNVNLIPVSNDMSHLFAIKEAIDHGEIVTMPCDRLFGSTKNYVTDFLGADATFPIGTFRLAAQLKAPVLAMFIMKEKGLQYQAYVFPLQTLENEKSSVIKAEFLAKQYVNLLETILKKYPEQWFNYYDFWK